MRAIRSAVWLTRPSLIAEIDTMLQRPSDGRTGRQAARSAGRSHRMTTHRAPLPSPQGAAWKERWRRTRRDAAAGRQWLNQSQVCVDRVSVVVLAAAAADEALARAMEPWDGSGIPPPLARPLRSGLCSATSSLHGPSPAHGAPTATPLEDHGGNPSPDVTMGAQPEG